MGNSGRSPQPHLHFQLQATPYVGSKTLKYPLSYYIKYQKDHEDFVTYSYPKEGEFVSDIKNNKILSKAFNLIPGMIFKVTSTNNKLNNSEWEVFTDEFNQTYIYCNTSKAFAYFINDGTTLYFTSFSGDKNTLLFYFYLSSFKIFLGDYKSVIHDTYPVHMVFGGIKRYLQDFIAPYYQYYKAEYQSKVTEINLKDNSFKILSSMSKMIAKKVTETIDFEITGNQKTIEKIFVKTKGTSFEIDIKPERKY
jgi:hypothetical protein